MITCPDQLEDATVWKTTLSVDDVLLSIMQEDNNCMSLLFNIKVINLFHYSESKNKSNSVLLCVLQQLIEQDLGRVVSTENGQYLTETSDLI